VSAQKEKKEWNKPKLLILIRGKPGEMVLAGCKDYNIDVEPMPVNNSCYEHRGRFCFICHDVIGVS